MVANIGDVAQKAKVSRATVSRVLNGKNDVSKETRNRVLDAIRELKYHPSALARSLVRQKTDAIGIIFTDIANPFFSRVMQGIEDIARKFNYNVVYANVHWDPQVKNNYVNFLRDGHVDGLLMMGYTIGNEDYVRELVEEGFPLVLIQYKIENLNANVIFVDNQGGGYMATKHLLNLGHRKIAYLGGLQNAQATVERQAGYRQALEEYGVPFDRTLVAFSDFTTESAIPEAKKLLTAKSRPTAVFGANDLMAYGVIHAARELGLSVPEELAVVGFDDIEMASLINPPLTTVHQARYEIGSNAAWNLIQQIENKEFRPTVTEFKTSLVIRESCGANLPKGGRL